MNSSRKNGDDSIELLIDFSSEYAPEMVVYNTCDVNLINNPFDIMETKAVNVLPNQYSMYSAVKQTPSREDPPCCNFLSPLWEPKIRLIRKSVSLTNLNNFENLETNYAELVKIDIMEDKSQVCGISAMCNSDSMINKSKGNFVLADINKNIKEIDEDYNSNSNFTQNPCKINIEHKSLCNEDEKKQIRKQTRQRIEMIIEKEKLKYKEKCLLKTFIFCTPQPREKYDASLITDNSLLNRGFQENYSNSDIDSSSSNQIFTLGINNYTTSNVSPEFPYSELNSFDLDSLEPEWVVDSYCGSNAPIDVQTKDKSMTELGLADNHIGSGDSTPIGNKTVVKSFFTMENPNKNPFQENVPLQHMVQDLVSNEFSQPYRQAGNQQKPVAFSTPTADTINADTLQFSSAESSVISRKSNVSRSSWSNFDETPKTSLNKTKCIRKHSTNMLYDENENTPICPNVSNSSKTASKCSSSSINLSSKAIEKKTEIQKSFKLKKSVSESKIEKLPKSIILNTNQLRSALPVFKRSTMMVKGKENVKPE